jgi:hypothetical protein
MLLVIPFSERALPLYRHIYNLGGVASHDVLLVGPHEKVEAIERALDVLKGSFANSDIFTGDHNYTSRNKLFHDTARYLDSVGCTDPWLWLDEQATPTRTGWLTEIAKEYFRNKTPFLGATEKSVALNPATGRYEEEPPRLAACSVYPVDFYADSILIRQLGYGPNETPWHVTLRFEMRRNGSASELIQHQPGTFGYRPQGEKLVFTEKAGVEVDPIRPGTLLITGVPDGSVIDALNPKKRKKDIYDDEPESIAS